MSNRSLFVFAASVIFFSIPAFSSEGSNWKREEVDLNAGAGRRIKAIRYPEGKEVPIRDQKRRSKESTDESSQQVLSTSTSTSTSTVYAGVIDSPPIDGFIPWIAVSATDRNDPYADLFNATKETSIVGNFLPANPQTDFAIGLFDTGASAHVMGYEPSQTLGVYNWLYSTGNETQISGVTGTVDVWVSNTLALFIAGFGAVNPANMTLDTSKLVGESNISIAVGYEPEPGAPDLPLAIGSPMSVFFTTVFRNDNPITLHRNGKNYTAPDITIYDGATDDDPDSEIFDPNIPEYPIKIPLELRPLGGHMVTYIPTMDFFGGGEMLPGSPSMITGNSAQSIFFVHAVDLVDNGNQAYDKDRFMIDTGAQVTVIGTRVAARLGIDVDNPEFVVDIQGVNGQIVPINGYYIDSLTIPALGEWVSFTNIPVILLDVASPEGGTLDGIIGMNLFTEYNMILRGGGMYMQKEPILELERITAAAGKLAGDVAPNPVDGVVDTLDLAAFANAWLSESGDANFNYLCDIAPTSISDGKVDLQDFSLMASNWLKILSQ